MQEDQKKDTSAKNRSRTAGEGEVVLNGEVLRKTGVNPFCIRLKAIHSLFANWCVAAVKCYSGPETDGDGEGQRIREFARKYCLIPCRTRGRSFTLDLRI